MQTFIHLYETFDEALHTVQELEAINIAAENISLLVINTKSKTDDEVRVKGKRFKKPVHPVPNDKWVNGLRTTFYSDITLHNLAGLDPVAAAGWLVTGAIDHTPEDEKDPDGNGLNSAAPTGLLTCLIENGIEMEQANAYVAGLKHGSTLVGARVALDLEDVVARIMRVDHAPLNPHVYGNHYETRRFNADEVVKTKKVHSNQAMLIAGGPSHN